MRIKRRLDKTGFTHTEAPGEWLAWWLNDYRERAGDKTRIRELIARLQALWDFMPDLEPSQAVPDNFDYQKMLKLEAGVANCTRRYKSSPSFMAHYDCRVGFVNSNESGATPEEWCAIEALEILVTSRMIDRLTYCSGCGKRWVFRSRKNHKFCSRHCRQARYESSPNRKTRRLEYMRWYYSQYQSPKAPAKKLTFKEWLKQQQRRKVA